MHAEFVVDFGKYKFPNDYFKNLIKEGNESIKSWDNYIVLNMFYLE